jgi:leader peptidase (prepilin peptidase)/N-methyltransferase
MIVSMSSMLIVGGMGYLGAALGSFVGAQVWRLRARQLREDAANGERVSKSEVARLRGLIRPVLADRSECLHCHHELQWYDLLPIISWLTLRGRCRYCHKPIGATEILVEVGLAATFIVSYLSWPLGTSTAFGVVSLVLWLMSCVLMAILFVYDAKWFLLPLSINVALIVTALVFAILRISVEGADMSTVVSALAAVGLMAGLYYIFSLFGWVGLGDSILGVGLALLLGKWELAFLGLFIANLLGCFMLVPLSLRGKLHRHTHIPFGPFLILGTVISLLWGMEIIAIVFAWSDTLLNLLMV